MLPLPRRPLSSFPAPQNSHWEKRSGTFRIYSFRLAIPFVSVCGRAVFRLTFPAARQKRCWAALPCPSSVFLCLRLFGLPIKTAPSHNRTERHALRLSTTYYAAQGMREPANRGISGEPYSPIRRSGLSSGVIFPHRTSAPRFHHPRLAMAFVIGGTVSVTAFLLLLLTGSF